MAKIGIDLGTTNTVVGMLYADGPHVVPREKGRVIPSVVAYPSENPADDLVGEDADAFEVSGPVVRSVKRLMGRTHTEALREGSDKYFPEGPGEVQLARSGEQGVGLNLPLPGGAARFLWPEEISAHILGEAKRHAERCLGVSVESAAVTVPAYFRDPHRDATLDAAQRAGLEVLGALLDEPTAAALAFAPHVGVAVGEPILVVDWGGGTLDITVLVSGGSDWAQLAIDGELTLGGDDVDRALVELAISRSTLPRQVLMAAQNRRELRRAAQNLKHSLSERAEARFLCPRLIEPETDRPLPGLSFTLSRSEFDEAIRPILKTAAACIERCVSRRDVARDEIRKVLLVGGSSKVPAFRGAIRALLPGAELHEEVDPMKAVAIGAAIYAERPPEIARICPYGYAYVHEDDTHTVILAPGQEIPTPERSRVTVPAATAFHAQTIYRLKLDPFTQGSRGEARFFPERRRVFARQMPPTEMGRKVDVEIWLDEHKTVKAMAHIHGLAKPYPLEGKDEGPDGLFSDLFDCQLDAEALLSANEKAVSGLMGDLRNAVALAEAAQLSKDREAAEALVESLGDLQEQFQAKRDEAFRNALLDPAQRARSRVEGWVQFFEREVVGRFAEVMEDAQFEEVKRMLRVLRLQMSTGASVDELASSLNELEEAVFSGEAEVSMRAWHWAATAGVPPGMAERLRTHALAFRDALIDEYAEGVSAAREALDGLLAQADQSWTKWRATGAVLEAGADLHVLRGTDGRGN